MPEIEGTYKARSFFVCSLHFYICHHLRMVHDATHMCRLIRRGTQGPGEWSCRVVYLRAADMFYNRLQAAPESVLARYEELAALDARSERGLQTGLAQLRASMLRWVFSFSAIHWSIRGPMLQWSRVLVSTSCAASCQS